MHTALSFGALAAVYFMGADPAAIQAVAVLTGLHIVIDVMKTM